MNKKVILFVMVVCLLTFAAVMTFSQSNPNVRWEYISLQVRGDLTSEQMNRGGVEGWELVSVTSDYIQGDIYYTAFFKRRLP